MIQRFNIFEVDLVETVLVAIVIGKKVLQIDRKGKTFVATIRIRTIFHFLIVFNYKPRFILQSGL